MPDWIDFIPLYVRTEDDIRSDMDADVNAGLQQGDEEFVDVRPGTFFHMVTQPFVIEAARIHDRISTLPAVAFIPFAFGIYLDYHAAALNTERNPATQSTGEVVFTAPVGTEISINTQVSTEQIDINVPPIYFVTIEDVTVNDALSSPTGLGYHLVDGEGVIAASTRYYKVTALDAAGETPVTALQEAVAVVTALGKVVIVTWTNLPDALPHQRYRVYEGPSSDGENRYTDVEGNSLSDDGNLTWTAGTPPTVNTTGGKVAASVISVLTGSGNDVSEDAISQMVSFHQEVTAVTNPEATSGAADVESDADLQVRLLSLQEGAGPGNATDYVNWALEWPEVGQAQCFPLFDGPGTVGLVIMDENGGPLSSEIVAEKQTIIDPFPALGGGEAPIDHNVTVMTIAQLLVAITAAITFEAGYSLDGAGNTQATRQAILAAIHDYMDFLPAGHNVVFNHLKAVFFTVDGILDVNLTAPAADVAVNGAIVPPQKAAVGTVTLT